MNSSVVTIDSEVMHGAPVFRGTRVPVEFLFHFLETNSTVDDFVDEYPSVKKEDVLAFLNGLKSEFMGHETRLAG